MHPPDGGGGRKPDQESGDEDSSYCAVTQLYPFGTPGEGLRLVISEQAADSDGPCGALRALSHAGVVKEVTSRHPH